MIMAKENRVEIRMPSELLERIDAQAGREGKSRSEMIRFMAEIYLRESRPTMVKGADGIEREF